MGFCFCHVLKGLVRIGNYKVTTMVDGESIRIEMKGYEVVEK